MAAFEIRDGHPDDGAALAAIYAPYVENSWVSFETEAPDATEMARRIADYGQSHAWLVAERGDTVLYQQAQVLAQWGEVEAGMQRLLKAREMGDSGLIYARNDPFLDPLRGDPRMAALLAGLGFEP